MDVVIPTEMLFSILTLVLLLIPVTHILVTILITKQSAWLLFWLIILAMMEMIALLVINVMLSVNVLVILFNVVHPLNVK
jgi:hypothetical protein